MSENKIVGNFDYALMELISRLNRAKEIPGLAGFAWDVLSQWDSMRGTDWYVGTKRTQVVEELENDKQ